MKEVKLKKESGKIFTKKKISNTISKNRNPFKAEKRSGLYMKRTNEKIKELSKKYNKSENFIKLLTTMCLNFEVNNYESTIENFLIKIK